MSCYIGHFCSILQVQSVHVFFQYVSSDLSLVVVVVVVVVVVELLLFLESFLKLYFLVFALFFGCFFSRTFIATYRIFHAFVQYFNFLSNSFYLFCLLPFNSSKFLPFYFIPSLLFLRHYLLYLFILVFLLVLIFISEMTIFFASNSFL